MILKQGFHRNPAASSYLSQLNRPNIVMELLDGESLSVFVLWSQRLPSCRVGGAKEIAWIPFGSQRGVGDAIADQKAGSDHLDSTFPMNLLCCIILWRVVDGAQPLKSDFFSLHAGIGTLKAAQQFYCRNALLDKGILVAANEANFFRSRIGAYFQADVFGGLDSDRPKRGMFCAQDHNIEYGKQHE